MKLATFTVQFELGPETRALIERLVGRSGIEIELGPKTRELVRSIPLGGSAPSAGASSLVAGVRRRVRGWQSSESTGCNNETAVSQPRR